MVIFLGWLVCRNLKRYGGTFGYFDYWITWKWKSTFVEGIAALDSAFMGERLSMDDIAWSMDNLIKMMDSKENINRTIWADEFIQGTGRFNQSTVGLKLKIGVCY